MTMMRNQQFTTTHIKKMFLKRRAAYYKSALQNLKNIFNYWIIYLYVFIGFIVSFILIFSILNDKTVLHNGEVLNIYVSALFFLLATQFSMKYFFHPADLIHLKQRYDIILKLRKYAIIHGFFYQLFIWLIIFLILGPLYFCVFPFRMDYYISLYIFSLSFSLVTSMIRKEASYYLREKSVVLFRLFYLSIIITLLIWFITIFCFADILYIFVGIIINVLIFVYTYNWGTLVIMPTLTYLVLHDTRKNILSAAVIGDLSEQQNAIKPYCTKPTILTYSNGLIIKEKKQYVLISVLLKQLLRTTSYKVMLVYLFSISGIALLLIESEYQFILLAVVTLYISFLIHKQHIEYFFAHTLMKSNVQQGFNKRYLDFGCTLLITIPCILLMLLIFNFI